MDVRFDVDPIGLCIIGYAARAVNGEYYDMNRHAIPVERGISKPALLTINKPNLIGYAISTVPTDDNVIPVLGQFPVYADPRLTAINVVDVYFEPDPNITVFDPACFKKLFIDNVSFFTSVRINHRDISVDYIYCEPLFLHYPIVGLRLNDMFFSITEVSTRLNDRSYGNIVIKFDVNHVFAQGGIVEKVMKCLFHPFGQRIEPSDKLSREIKAKLETAFHHVVRTHLLQEM